jgi:proteasome accessory factor C
VEVARRPGPLADIRDALARERRLHLTYFVPARDETTERDVDPVRLLMVDGRWYLEGWCYRAEEVRLFRLDRIEQLTVLDVATEPREVAPRDLREGLFRPSPEDTVVTLELDPGARWIVDYYPMESVDELPDERLLVRLRAADDRWLRTLVLRLGGSARVLDPPELADAVRERAEQALEAYLRP